MCEPPGSVNLTEQVLLARLHKKGLLRRSGARFFKIS